MATGLSKLVAMVLGMIGLCALPACDSLGGGTGNGNDNTNSNTNTNTNTNDNDNDDDDDSNTNSNTNDNDNSNTNTNGNDNSNSNGNDNDDESDFALFTDPDGDFSTTRVRDIDGETVRFRISNQAIVYQDGTEYQAGSWPVTGNFLGGVSFQARFGTEDGMRQAYFTETGPATICDFVVSPTTFSIFPTSTPVPQE